MSTKFYFHTSPDGGWCVVEKVTPSSSHAIVNKQRETIYKGHCTPTPLVTDILDSLGIKYLEVQYSDQEEYEEIWY